MVALKRCGTERKRTKPQTFGAHLPLAGLNLPCGTVGATDHLRQGHSEGFCLKCVLPRKDQVVQHNSKSGVIMSSTALALQTVTRHQAGNYTCIASNVEGDGESNTVDLKLLRHIVTCQVGYVVHTPAYKLKVTTSANYADRAAHNNNTLPLANKLNPQDVNRKKLGMKLCTKLPPSVINLPSSSLPLRHTQNSISIALYQYYVQAAWQ
uniref:Ig-like domain-containing protein n=1 Tax=Anopheles merus TaxID=30066 RepID=A0A182UUQ9_ANOME